MDLSVRKALLFVNAVPVLIRAARTPPRLMDAWAEQMKANRNAVLLSTILIFISRALHFQKPNGLLDAFLVSIGFAALVVIFRYSGRWTARLAPSGLNLDAPTHRKWESYLIAAWIIALLMTIADSVLNILGLTRTLPNFLLGELNAAIFISIAAVLVLMAKTHFVDRKPLGSPAEIAAYCAAGIALNTVMLFVFIYLAWTA